MPAPQSEFIRGPALAKRLGVSLATLHRWASGNNTPQGFPSAYRLGPKVVVWRRGEVDAWLANLAPKTDEVA